MATTLKTKRYGNNETENGSRDSNPMADPSLENSESNFGLVDWFWVHWDMKVQSLGNSLVNLQNNPLVNYMWPSSTPYHSPLNPIFLAGAFSTEIFNRKSCWMAQDGLVPLLWFYKLYPTPPKNLKTRILVHDSFSAYVPTEWRSMTGTYRVCSLPGMPTKPQTKLLLTGVCSELNCSPTETTRILAKLGSIFKNADLANMEKRCFLLERTAPGIEHQQNFFPAMLIEIAKVVSTNNIDFIDWRTFDLSSNFQGYSMFEFNDRLLYADSYLTHHALTRGATLIHTDKVEFNPNAGKFIQLSAYHGVQIKEKVEGEYALSPKGAAQNYSPERDHFETVMRSAANLKFPWPTWIKDWRREAQKLVSPSTMTQ